MTALEKIIFVVLVLAVAGGGYWYWRSQQPAAPVAVAPAAPPVAATPQEGEPSVQHPIEQAPAGGADNKPLPALPDSDAVATEALASIAPGNTLPDFVVTKGLIRHIVATVDNLPRDKAALSLWPVKPVPGTMLAANTRDGRVISTDNAARYTPYVKWMESLDTQKVAAQYVRLYPLFQDAYKELGYPKGYFNDRLVGVIDHLLATPEVNGAIRVEQPKVLYEYADPVLKSTSAGQQILLRMGPENAQKVKAKLRALRKEITQQAPKG